MNDFRLHLYLGLILDAMTEDIEEIKDNTIRKDFGDRINILSRQYNYLNISDEEEIKTMQVMADQCDELYKEIQRATM